MITTTNKYDKAVKEAIATGNHLHLREGSAGAVSIVHDVTLQNTNHNTTVFTKKT